MADPSSPVNDRQLGARAASIRRCKLPGRALPAGIIAAVIEVRYPRTVQALEARHPHPGGALSHEFELGGVRETRMVSPYQIWMLCRICDAMSEQFNDQHQSDRLRKMLTAFKGGSEILTLPNLLRGCRLHKKFEQLFIDIPE